MVKGELTKGDSFNTVGLNGQLDIEVKMSFGGKIKD